MSLPDDIICTVLAFLFEIDLVSLFSVRLVSSTFRKRIDGILKEEYEVTSRMLEASMCRVEASSILKRITSQRLNSPFSSKSLHPYFRDDPNRCIHIGMDAERCTNVAKHLCHCELHQQAAMSNPPKCFVATF